MYARAAGTGIAAGVAGGTLARTGFHAFVLVALALCLVVGGLVILRVALTRQQTPADDLS